MIHIEFRSQHNPEYHKLLDELEAKYPPMRFVGIRNNQECGNSDDFDELVRVLDASGFPRSETYIVQVGNEAPDYVEFLYLEFPSGPLL